MSASRARRSSNFRFISAAKESIGPPPLVLGAIEGCVGLLQKKARIDIGHDEFGRVPQRNANAHADSYLVAVQFEFLVQRIDQALCQHFGIRKLAHAHLQDGKFVAAQPCQRIRLADAGAQPAGNSDQQPIAGGVAKRVVHLLEPVEIQVEHGEHRAFTTRPGQ
jgi:hypothetical protein